MAQFAGRLSDNLDRPIYDKTGLSGQFDIHLEFPRGNGMSGMPARNADADNSGNPAPPVDTPVPSIFTAIQEQPGLKLSPDKGSVDVLVIDHVERPSEN